jgi:hypothetical protein
MTVAPHSVGQDLSLSVALRRMQELKTRHLPVLEEGRLKGIISDRDVALAEAFGLNPEQVSVEEAMCSEPYTVSSHTPLSRVARAMAAHKYTCAVVTDSGELRGIFTTTDALRALSEVLEELGPEQESMAPSQVREVMHTEHVNIRQLLERAEDQAQQVMADQDYGDREVRALRDAARQLYTGLSAHIELEDRILAPALKQTDAWGDIRAAALMNEHAEQKRAVEGALIELDDLAQPARALAVHLHELVEHIRAELMNEEETLLNEELLRDDPIIENPETD